MIVGSTSRLDINTVQMCSSGNAAVGSTLYVDVIVGDTELMSFCSNDEITNNSKDQFLLWNNVGEQTLFD